MSKIKIKASFYSGEWEEDLADFGYEGKWEDLSEPEREEVWDSLAQRIKDEFPITLNIKSNE